MNTNTMASCDKELVGRLENIMALESNDQRDIVSTVSTRMSVEALKLLGFSHDTRANIAMVDKILVFALISHIVTFNITIIWAILDV